MWCNSDNAKSIIITLLIDIDECDERNFDCEQGCVNVNGSYACFCLPGYSLASNLIYCEGKI